MTFKMCTAIMGEFLTLGVRSLIHQLENDNLIGKGP